MTRDTSRARLLLWYRNYNKRVSMANRVNAAKNLPPPHGKGGRPPTPTTPEGKIAKRARDQRLVLERQQRDCRSLAKIIDEVKALPDHGAGTSSVAGAVAQLARSTSILHDLERKAHDMGAVGESVRAVIAVPVLLNMEDWAKAAGVAMAGLTEKLPDPDEGRHIEEQIQGIPPAGQEPCDKGEA